MRTSILRTGIALVLAAATGRAQDTIAPGFQLASSRALPASFAAYCTLSSGERVVFDGASIDLYDAGGGHLLHLGDFPSFVFPSFVRADPSERFAIAGESSTGELYRVLLDGSGTSPLASLFFNYDAVFEDASHLIVSAATCGWSCGNDLVRVDVASGATTFVAHLPGASGPVAMALDGALLYGTVSALFPAPAGSSSVVAFSQRQLLSGALLGLGDATLVRGGLDGAASLAVDPVFGNVFVAESAFDAKSAVLELTRDGEFVGSVIESQDFLWKLELLRSGGPGHFHAFQPSDGVRMCVSTGDRVLTLRPARPRLSIAGSGAARVLRVVGGPAGGSMLVTFTSATHAGPNESALTEPFGDFLYVTPFEPAEVRRVGALVPLNAAGAASRSLALAPGERGPHIVFQALLLDASGRYVGASNPVE